MDTYEIIRGLVLIAGICLDDSLGGTCFQVPHPRFHLRAACAKQPYQSLIQLQHGMTVFSLRAACAQPVSEIRSEDMAKL